MNLQEQILRIKSMMGIINENFDSSKLLIEQNNDVIDNYVSDTRLKKILRDIQNTLGENFTDNHFNQEINWSGNIKKESGQLLPEVEQAFNRMKNESGCNDIFIKDKVSYRSYEDQRDQFLQYATGTNKIDTALKRASIPGFSQHHTGRSIDYGGNTICLKQNAWPNGDFDKPNKWGFTLPYMSGNIRMKEPWHLYYEGTQKQTSNLKPIKISNPDLNQFKTEIETLTKDSSLDINSIVFDMDKRIFEVNVGSTKVYKIYLLWSDVNGPCESCVNKINKNPEYSPKVLKDVKWQNGTRIAQLIALYPPK